MRFEQDRIHACVRLYAAGIGLNDLGPADFVAFQCHPGIEGHVLGLEGSDQEAPIFQQSAESGGNNTFAYPGTGALKHDRGVHGQSAWNSELRSYLCDLLEKERRSQISQLGTGRFFERRKEGLNSLD